MYTERYIVGGYDMKRSTLVGAVVAAVAVIGIGAAVITNNQASKKGAYSVALVTSTGGVDDKSFNQSAWAGIKKYGEQNGSNKVLMAILTLCQTIAQKLSLTCNKLLRPTTN